MKNLFFLNLLALLFILPSCKNVDTTLISGMTEQVTTLQNLLPSLDESKKSVTGLLEQIAAAPVAMKNDAVFGPKLNELTDQANGVNNKVAAMGAELSERISKLQTLAADYASGKMTTEDVKKEFDVIKQDMGNYAKSVGRVNDIFSGYSNSFNSLMTEWNGK